MESFSAGVISGFKIILDVGQPIVKNLTQEAKEYVNNPNTIASQRKSELMFN